MRHALIGLVAATLLVPTFSASAQQADAMKRADPTQQALVQMVQEGQGREATSLVQVYDLRAQLAAEQAKTGAATKTISELNAKIAGTAKAPESAGEAVPPPQAK